jgi:hypothetical protein
MATEVMEEEEVEEETLEIIKVISELKEEIMITIMVEDKIVSLKNNKETMSFIIDQRLTNRKIFHMKFLKNQSQNQDRTHLVQAVQ